MQLLDLHQDAVLVGVGHLPATGGEIYGVSVNCLENAEPRELIDAPITYVDGRHDNWQQAPAEIRHL